MTNDELIELLQGRLVDMEPEDRLKVINQVKDIYCGTCGNILVDYPNWCGQYCPRCS